MIQTGPLEINIPEYVVTTYDEVDYVEIPDGDIVFEEDKPQVPYYTKMIEYPSGYHIQDVILLDRSGLENRSGLTLPISSINYAGSQRSSSVSSALSDWYPTIDYSWDLIYNPDNTSTLPVSYTHLRAHET